MLDVAMEEQLRIGNLIQWEIDAFGNSSFWE
jgi:hypothetical protein